MEGWSIAELHLAVLNPRLEFAAVYAISIYGPRNQFSSSGSRRVLVL